MISVIFCLGPCKVHVWPSPPALSAHGVFTLKQAIPVARLLLLQAPVEPEFQLLSKIRNVFQAGNYCKSAVWLQTAVFWFTNWDNEVLETVAQHRYLLSLCNNCSLKLFQWCSTLQFLFILHIFLHSIVFIQLLYGIIIFYLDSLFDVPLKCALQTNIDFVTYIVTAPRPRFERALIKCTDCSTQVHTALLLQSRKVVHRSSSSSFPFECFLQGSPQ